MEVKGKVTHVLN